MCFPEKDRKVMETDRPGLSGMGAIAFRDEEDILQKIDDHERFYSDIISPYKSKLECWYIQNKSVGLYFKLIWLTVKAVLKPGDNSWRRFANLPVMPMELEGVL